MNPALGDLYRLQQLDTALARCAKMLRELDPGSAEKEVLERLSQAEESLAAELRQAQAALKDAELQLQTLENKQREHASLLFSGRIRNPKELEGLQQEVESLKRRRGTLDEQVLGLMERVETLTGQVARLKEQKDEAMARYRHKAEAYLHAARALRKEIAGLQAQRAQQALGIPGPLLKKYEAIRQSKGGIGAAKVDGNRCGACRTILPRSTIVALRDTDDLVACESCGRLLCALSEE